MLLQKFTKMRLVLTWCVLLFTLQQCVAPPVSHSKEEDKPDDTEVYEASIFEYQRYLKEVVETLESDPKFREKLQSADQNDIRTGKIAYKLDLVNRHIRTKLDEIKRRELERLRHLATKEFELTNNLDLGGLKAEHLDHMNPHTFEINDLKKLIAKTTEDLAEADKKRRTEFKEYEMEKKFEKELSLKALDEEERKKAEAEFEKMEEKHKKHAPLHHPGSKQQLEEVWEKEDHMGDQEFKPKDFFFMHDLDGNGVWDADEVKALFLKELNKIYSPGAPEDDPLEKEEEMERMREHVFQEADLDKNGLIDFQEFLARTKDSKFQQDDGWKTIDEQQIYTEEEYKNYEKNRLHEIQQAVAQGILPPEALSNPAILNPHFPQQFQHHPQQESVHQAPPMTGQMPQNQYQQVPPQYNQPNQQNYHYQGQIGQPAAHPEVPQQPNVQYHQPNAQNIQGTVQQLGQNNQQQQHAYVNQQQNTHQNVQSPDNKPKLQASNVSHGQQLVQEVHPNSDTAAHHAAMNQVIQSGVPHINKI